MASDTVPRAAASRLLLQRRREQVHDHVEAFEQARAGWRQRDAARVADQKLRAELFFQLADLVAERGLADLQFLRRAAEIAAARHAGEIPQLAQFQPIAARDRTRER